MGLKNKMQEAYSRLVKDENVNRFKFTFKCPWPKCGHVFTHWVGTSSGEKHSKVSTQIVCPRCGNFLKTWSGS